MKFYLISYRGSKPHWRTKGIHEKYGESYFNVNDGFSPVDSGETIVEEVEAEDWHHLDYSKTCLVADDDSDTGWLDRSGRYHPCSYGDHDQYALLVLKQSVLLMESQGWVRVLGKSLHMYTAKISMSAEQRNWLSKRGHNLRDDE